MIACGVEIRIQNVDYSLRANLLEIDHFSKTKRQMRSRIGPFKYDHLFFTFIHAKGNRIFSDKWDHYLLANEGLLVDADTAYYAEPAVDNRFQAINVHFSLTGLPPGKLYSVFPMVIRQCMPIEYLSNLLSELCLAQSEDKRRLAHVLFQQFILELRRIKILEMQKAPSRLIQIVKKQLELCDVGQMSRSELARHCCVSPSYLSTVFKREEGISLIDYIRRKKVQRGKKLMRDSSKNLTEIAGTLDMDVYSFSRLFKQVTGMPPSRYSKVLHSYRF